MCGVSMGWRQMNAYPKQATRPALILMRQLTYTTPAYVELNLLG